MASVIGDDDAIDSVLDGERGILASDDTFEHQFRAGQAADALHILPTQFHAVLAHEGAYRAQHVHWGGGLRPGDLGEVAVAAGAAGVGLAVEVAHAGALDGLRAYGVGSS